MRLRPSGLVAASASLAAAFALVSPTAASAQDVEPEGVRWSVLPSGPQGPTDHSHFVYSLPPGGEITDWVGISNLSNEPLAVRIYATDAFTTRDGAFALLRGDEAARNVGTWIALNESEYTIPVGKRIDVPFTLTVPPDAEPGDHPGGIIASVAGQEADESGQLVTVDRRVAARVYLRVDGAATPAVEVSSVAVSYDNPLQPFGGGDASVTYRLRNTGNVRVTGAASVQISGPLGWRLAKSGEIAIPELLPGAEAEFTQQFDGVFPAGRLNAEVVYTATTADDQAVPAARRASAIWAMPWLLVVALLLVGAAFGARFWAQRRRRAMSRDAEELQAAPV